MIWFFFHFQSLQNICISSLQFFKSLMDHVVVVACFLRQFSWWWIFCMALDWSKVSFWILSGSWRPAQNSTVWEFDDITIMLLDVQKNYGRVFSLKNFVNFVIALLFFPKLLKLKWQKKFKSSTLWMSNDDVDYGNNNVATKDQSGQIIFNVNMQTIF